MFKLSVITLPLILLGITNMQLFAIPLLLPMNFYKGTVVF